MSKSVAVAKIILHTCINVKRNTFRPRFLNSLVKNTRHELVLSVKTSTIAALNSLTTASLNHPRANYQNCFLTKTRAMERARSKAFIALARKCRKKKGWRTFLKVNRIAIQQKSLSNKSERVKSPACLSKTCVVP